MVPFGSTKYLRTVEQWRSREDLCITPSLYIFITFLRHFAGAIDIVCFLWYIGITNNRRERKMKEEIRCPMCRSRKTIWLGWWTAKGGIKKHRRHCNNCGHSWFIIVPTEK